MTAAFFRYAWISADQLQGLFPPLASSLIGLAEEGRALADAAQGSRSRAAGRLIVFAERPDWRAPPGEAYCRRALDWADDAKDEALGQLARWCLKLVLALTAPPLRDDAREIALLDAVLETDYPALLAHAAPEAAAFQLVLAGGDACWRDDIRDDRRKRQQAIRLFLGYAEGALGRTAPRDGWTGFGFARIAPDAPPLVIERAIERFWIEPDLGWFADHVLPDGALGPLPGEDAWAFLDRSFAACGTEGAAWCGHLATLRGEAERHDPWSFAGASALHALGGTMAAGAARPHRWWLTRGIAVEQTMPPPSMPPKATSGGAASEERAPYPVRIAQATPAAILLRAEELQDWVVDAAVATHLPPIGDCHDGVDVLRLDEAGGVRMFHEPNPRRVADHFALYCETPPAYLAVDCAASIAVPSDLVDNRVTRVAVTELGLVDLPEEADAMLRIALVAPATAPCLARELASPRYRAAADLEPRWFDRAGAVATTHGRIDVVRRIWLLDPEEAKAIARAVRTADRLALAYRLEIAPLLGDGAWAELLVDGKRARMPVGEPLAFERLLNTLRTAEHQIALFQAARQPQSCCAMLHDGSTATLDLYVDAPPR